MLSDQPRVADVTYAEAQVENVQFFRDFDDVNYVLYAFVNKE